jgi:hypothetical protein
VRARCALGRIFMGPRVHGALGFEDYLVPSAERPGWNTQHISTSGAPNGAFSGGNGVLGLENPVGTSAPAEELDFGTMAVPGGRPDFADWGLDLKNAFNGFSPVLLAQRLAEAPSQIRRLLPFVCALLGPSAPLATGASWADFASVEGTQQGCPLGPALFCMGFKPHPDWLLAPRCPAGERGHWDRGNGSHHG